MKFGSVTDPSSVDFTLPETHSKTLELLKAHQSDEPFKVYVGCAKWNKKDLKGFYPRGTKDELAYYATKFNSIELNATFYNAPSKEQVLTWKNKTGSNFKFFPKIPQSISHYSRLLNTDEKVKAFVDATVLFEEKLGMAFLQMHENYKPKDFARLEEFLKTFPKGYPLGVEVRNESWFTDQEVAERFYELLEKTGKTNILVDTAGRRDLLHMRLTTPVSFVRYVGANAPSDYTRLEDWVLRIGEWRKAGLQELYFFIHQNMEEESPLLADHFIKKMNSALGLNLKSPNDDKLF
ncbi:MULTISPECIES: DUF72 domain-containing protein [Sphingobacterium]|uniref:DUF72 domain-containing protein n=1 Tax=Sphingobacterium populi TaxID=1812824 RepID=A0ABW5UGJ0_9SPHI|nr:DUF72 domain-containing protein [Sphingobacterium sp. CFCC 11742]